MMFFRDRGWHLGRRGDCGAASFLRRLGRLAHAAYRPDPQLRVLRRRAPSAGSCARSRLGALWRCAGFAAALMLLRPRPGSHLGACSSPPGVVDHWLRQRGSPARHPRSIVAARRRRDRRRNPDHRGAGHAHRGCSPNESNRAGDALHRRPGAARCIRLCCMTTFIPHLFSAAYEWRNTGVRRASPGAKRACSSRRTWACSISAPRRFSPRHVRDRPRRALESRNPLLFDRLAVLAGLCARLVHAAVSGFSTKRARRATLYRRPADATFLIGLPRLCCGWLAHLLRPARAATRALAAVAELVLIIFAASRRRGGRRSPSATCHGSAAARSWAAPRSPPDWPCSRSLEAERRPGARRFAPRWRSSPSRGRSRLQQRPKGASALPPAPTTCCGRTRATRRSCS